MADMIHSDNELGQKMQPVPADASNSQTELAENSHPENGASPLLDGELTAPERPNVNAMREAIETQAEMEVKKPISETQKEVQQGGKTVDVSKTNEGKTIIINIAKKISFSVKGKVFEVEFSNTKTAAAFVKEAFRKWADFKLTPSEGIGGEHQPGATAGHAGGAFGGTDIDAVTPKLSAANHSVAVMRNQASAPGIGAGNCLIFGYANRDGEFGKQLLWWMKMPESKYVRAVQEIVRSGSGDNDAKREELFVRLEPLAQAVAAGTSTDQIVAQFKNGEQKQAGFANDKPDFWGYDNWLTGHVALLIDNEQQPYETKLRLTREALTKGMSAKKLGIQFSGYFRRQERESRALYEENATDARDERGKFEREQLEGKPQPSPEQVKGMSREEYVKHFVDQMTDAWYEVGGVSDWENPAGGVDWEAIAREAMDEERIQNPGKYKTTTKEDDRMLKDMGIKMESLKTAKRMPAKGSAEWHQLKIAIKTLQMPDPMVGVMGGPSKEEARRTLLEYGIDPAKYGGGDKHICPACESGICGQCANASPLEGKPRCEHGCYLNQTDSKQAGEGATKTPEDIEKEAGFNFFFPGQVLREVRPELQHEIVDYPNATNTPMPYADITGDKDELPSELAIEAAIDASLNPTKLSYVSTDPAGAMGIGRDGKPQILEGAPLRKELDVRGPMFTDEFYGEREMVPSRAFASELEADGHDSSRGPMYMEEYHDTYQSGPKDGFKAAFKQAFLALHGEPLASHLANNDSASFWKQKLATADEAKQFSLFLKKVMGEVAASFISAFKVTSRPILNEVPGTGEIQLANIEQPQGLSSFNLVHTQSRVKRLLEKLTDSEIRDAINGAFAQAAVWHEGEDGGFNYEIFVRPQSIDQDSMLMKYEFVTGSKE